MPAEAWLQHGQGLEIARCRFKDRKSGEFRASRRSRKEDDLADSSALSDGIKGEMRIGKGEALADQRADAARPGPVGHDGKLAGGLGRLSTGKVAPEDTDELAALEKWQIQRDAGDLARGEADDEVPPAPRDTPQRRLAKLAADGVKDDVDALRIPLLEEGLEVAGAVVD